MMYETVLGRKKITLPSMDLVFWPYVAGEGIVRERT